LLTGPINEFQIFTIFFIIDFFVRKNRESLGFEVSELVVGPGEQNINRAIFDIELTISQSGHRNMQVKTRTSISFPLHSRTTLQVRFQISAHISTNHSSPITEELCSDWL